jgi:hypothetical protein
VKTLPHPTHARNTWIGNVLLFVAVPVPFVVGGFAAPRAWWLSGGLLVLWFGWMFLSTSVARCPQCRRLLRRGRMSEPLPLDTRRPTQLFECTRCGIRWDTGFTLET